MRICDLARHRKGRYELDFFRNYDYFYHLFANTIRNSLVFYYEGFKAKLEQDFNYNFKNAQVDRMFI